MRRVELAIWARRATRILAASIACVATVATIAPAFADPIAVETLFRKPQYGGAVLSPNGRYLAALVSVKDRRAVAVLDLNENSAKVIPVAGGDAIRVVWQNDNRMIVTVGDLDRASGDAPIASGTWAVDRDGGNPRRVFGLFVRVIADSDEILVSAHDRSRSSIDLYRENTRSGHRELMSFETPGDVIRWVLDFDGVPRAAVTADIVHDKEAWYLRKDASAPWQRMEETTLGNLSAMPFQFSPDGKILYVDARRGNDRSAVYEYSIDGGKWNGPVVQHPQRDINARFIVDTADRKLLGLEYVDDTPKAVWFDQEWATVQKSVDAALPGTSNFLQHHGDRWIITASSDTNPGEVYLLERSTMKMSKVFSYEPWIDPAAMAATRWVHYPSRDGLSIPALLTVPKGSEGKSLPLIVDIHGGPYVEASGARYNAEVQFFASRGYAVLRPQYRGTRGFGSKFAKAGFRKWGDEMQDDLEDGVKWAAAQGIADPARVCFFGASYGGYAALWETIRNPGLIKCAVSYAGVTSIAYMFDNAQTDISLLAEKSSEMAVEIGDPATERARFKRVSPLEHADRVGVPIFLAYGLSDRRVPSVHGSEFKSALDKFGKTYELATYSGEAHGLNLDENVFDFYNQVGRFLAKYLSAPAAPGS